jgi:FkbM family methyltransferase
MTRSIPYGANMISYAQNGEDVVLNRAFKGKTEGFYVDVGANDPTTDSVTRHFYELGWHGINIEPQLELFEALTEARPRDVNLNIGVGRDPGYLTFHHVPASIGNSTFSEEVADKLAAQGYSIETRKVDLQRLDQVFEDHVGDQLVDFLKVDAEGLEEEVFAGFDLERWRPRVIVVEGLQLPSVWRERLGTSGYHNPLWDGINFFFVRHEDAEELGEALSRPATVTDNYIIWAYLKLIEGQRDMVVRLIQDYLARAATDRAGASLDWSEVLSAAHVLGQVLSDRPDLLAHFGTPPATDVDGLFAWAAGSGWRAGEPYHEDLARWRDIYTRLAYRNVFRAVAEASSFPRRLRRRLSTRRLQRRKAARRRKQQ